MHLTIDVVVAPYYKGKTLRQALKEIPLGSLPNLSLDITKSKEFFGNLKHKIVFHSENDLDFEFLTQVHKKLRDTPCVVSYEVISMYQSFYVEHGHGEK